MFAVQARLVAIVILVLSAPAGPVGSAGADHEDVCVDASGLYRVPSGLVLGGPDDNSRSSLYKEWVEDCSLKATETHRDVATPYARAVETWAECMRSSLVIVQEAVRTAPSSMGSRPAEVATLPTTSCGAAPDPTAVGGDGQVWKRIPTTTISGADGSITFSTYSYAHEGMSKQTGRASTVFWGDGSASEVADEMDDGHWKDNTATRCSDVRYFLVGPAASQKWVRTTKDIEAHEGGSNCLENQYHMRLNEAGLDHGGWGDWSVANVHEDKDWHIQAPGTPGVTHLHSDQAGFAQGWMKVWSPTLNFYIHVYRI